jgi:hypothetical protein
MRFGSRLYGNILGKSKDYKSSIPLERGEPEPGVGDFTPLGTLRFERSCVQTDLRTDLWPPAWHD